MRTSAPDGQTWWLAGMLLISLSSLLGSVNMITTIVQLRVPGLTWFRLPFFVWSQLITAFLLQLAFPALQAAAMLQAMDRLVGHQLLSADRTHVSGRIVDAAGDGSALLWQHLFRFLAHPEVYVLILPAMGIVAEIIANNTRKPLWGYRVMVYSIFALGFLSFLVWAHHMFLTGMGTTISAFFQATTLIISIPSVVVVTSLLLSLYGGSIRGRIHFAGSLICLNLIFLPMFVQGLAGVNRRLWDGGQIYMHAQGVIPLNVPMSYAAFALGAFQIFFIANLFGSLRFGRRAAANPWGATTLEWASGDAPPRAYRDPYEYSVPGAALDYIPQNERSGV